MEPDARPSLKQVINTLNEFLVDDTIKSPEARTFWKLNFMNSETGEFHEVADAKYFMEFVKRNLDVSKSELDGLEAILTWNWSGDLPEDPRSNKSNFISMQKFNMVCEMFGNFFLLENRAIVIEMCNWVKNDWFHGVIDHSKALARLEFRDVGSFLIKLSVSEPGFPFTLLFVNQDRQTVYKRMKFEKVPGTQANYRYSVFGNTTYHQTLLQAIQNCGFYLNRTCTRKSMYQ